MDEKKVTAEEIEALLAGDFRQFAEQMAAAMDEAKAGSIIADSDEQAPRRPPAPTIQAAMEGGTPVRLASKIPPTGCPL